MQFYFRNLSFDTTNESLKEFVSRFGDVSLTIMCKFAGTDQPTGNAFVHFKEKESADKCLEELEVNFYLLFGDFLNLLIIRCPDFSLTTELWKAIEQFRERKLRNLRRRKSKERTTAIWSFSVFHLYVQELLKPKECRRKMQSWDNVWLRRQKLSSRVYTCLCQQSDLRYELCLVFLITISCLI